MGFDDIKDKRYRRLRVRGPSGHVFYTSGCGDAVAIAMIGMNRQSLMKVAKANNLFGRMIGHDKKNDGHYRMVLGQILRQLVIHDHPVVIDGKRIESLEQSVQPPRGFTIEPIYRKE